MEGAITPPRTGEPHQPAVHMPRKYKICAPRRIILKEIRIMGNHHMKGARIRHSQVLLHPIRSENLLTELSVIAPVNFKTIQADIITFR